MKYNFEELEPEHDLQYVQAPQMLVVNTKNQTRKVFVYFMTNTALEISGGIVESAMGRVKLQYKAEKAGGACSASQTLRKVVFTFPDPQGMASSFEFHGQKS